MQHIDIISTSYNAWSVREKTQVWKYYLTLFSGISVSVVSNYAEFINSAQKETHQIVSLKFTTNADINYWYSFVQKDML